MQLDAASAQSGAALEKRVACDRFCGLDVCSFFRRFHGVIRGTGKNRSGIE
jgi:hypothetical protein